MNILNLENISKTYMSKPVLNNVCIGIDDSDKIGVVGANGTGKSTLLGITAGVIEADEGAVVMGTDIRISYLPQIPEFDDHGSILEQVLAHLFSPRVLADYRMMKNSECLTQSLTPQLHKHYRIDKLMFLIGKWCKN